MNIKLNIPFVTLNEYIDKERASKYGGAQIKRKQTNLVCSLAKSQNFKLLAGQYNVHIQWTKPDNRIDHDNIAFAKKFIFDGLVKAGSITGDGPKVINSLSDSFVLDKKAGFIKAHVFFKRANCSAINK